MVIREPRLEGSPFEASEIPRPSRERRPCYQWSRFVPTPAARPPARRPSVLLLSAEPLGRRMLGSAIRTYELGRALAPYADVVLAAPQDGDTPAVDLPVVTFHRADPRPLRPHLARATAVVTQPVWPHVAALLRRSQSRLVVDLYDPEPFEVLEFLGGRPEPLRRAVSALVVDRIAGALRDADHLMCASEAQRDLWLGMLVAERLLTPAAYDGDPSLRSRIDTVPFGVPDRAPAATGRGPRERVAGIGPDDEIVLWNGGIWNWLDAPTAIRAVAALARRRPQVRLLFMGAANEGPARRATEEARRIAADLGVLGTTVLFHDGWVPYGERADWLLQAACALSTHADHLEARFAFRTRLLDCFWAGLPVVATGGDDLAARVQRDGLGEVVPPVDPAALAAALERVLARGREAFAPALARASDELAWSRVTAPLVRWVTAAERTPRGTRALGGRGTPRPGQALRDAGFRLAFGAMGKAGVRRWPRL